VRRVDLETPAKLTKARPFLFEQFRKSLAEGRLRTSMLHRGLSLPCGSDAPTIRGQPGVWYMP
jgi:hypothetical protein